MVSADLFVFIDQRLLEWSAPPDPVGKPTYCSVKDPENVGKSAFISVWGVRTKSWTLRCPDWSPHV
ncbi:hypothetical protein, partial [Adlercreutzia equolifaciens]|uniref:hypothetical protein n=1 Tax=Adlercreutzia equolifaciens TaxID=446660 RepID=UPI001EDCAC05